MTKKRKFSARAQKEFEEARGDFEARKITRAKFDDVIRKTHKALVDESGRSLVPGEE